MLGYREIQPMTKFLSFGFENCVKMDWRSFFCISRGPFRQYNSRNCHFKGEHRHSLLQLVYVLEHISLSLHLHL